jgi:hypothetical protein
MKPLAIAESFLPFNNMLPRCENFILFGEVSSSKLPVGMAVVIQ